MNDVIIQIRTTPIPEDEYIIEDDYFESWFLGGVADYLSNTTKKERMQWIENFASIAGITVNNDTQNKETFTVNSKENYFETAYKTFQNKIKNLKDISLEEFAGNEKDQDFRSLALAYNDKLGTYVDYQGYLMTLDRFVHLYDMSNPQTYYIGGIVSYHC